MIPRWAHHLYATLLGYYWLPCPICERMVGGHETGDVAVRTNGHNLIACNQHKALAVLGDDNFPIIITTSVFRTR